MTLTNSDTKELVYSTTNMSVFLREYDSSFVIKTLHTEVLLNLCALIVLKRKIDAIDIVGILEDHTTPDIEIVSMLNCDRILVLNINEILELRELLPGAFAMLELNSIIHRELIRPSLF